MKRKRFVKLLMAQGVQRNEAQLIAMLVQRKYWTLPKKQERPDGSPEQEKPWDRK